MPLVMPPWGWTKREEAERTLFVGFDFAFEWPFAVLFAGYVFVGYPSFGRSLGFWFAGMTGAALLALMRGFRLEVSPRGFTMWRTWCWVPYRRVRLPLSASVETAGGFGDPPDRMVIERKLHSEDITLGSRSTCEGLREDVRAAQERWRAASARAPLAS